MQRLTSLVFVAALLFSISVPSVQAQDLSILRFEPNESTICSNQTSNRKVTRSMMAQIMGSTIDWNQFQPVKVADVSKAHPNYGQIQKAIALGWMSVDQKNGRFYPNRLLRRDEGFAILSQTQGVPERPAPKRSGKWTDRNFQIAKAQGIVNLDRGDRPKDLMLQQDLCYGLKRLGLIPIVTPSVPTPSNGSNFPWAIVSLVGSACVAGTIGLWLLFRKPPKRTSFPRSLVSPTPMTDTVKCLLVTEECNAGGKDGTRIADEKIFTFPASFGDFKCTYVVKSLPNVEGRIFEITNSQGNLYLMPYSQKALTCNRISVPPQGLPLDKYTPSRIQYQHICWRIQPLCKLPTRKTSSAYFAQ
ncbi:hypothetical protein H6F89_23010 [Cyanobacteria bacterium FACHB-63]|nr:hypothetical protein [Cyanobacteria bacterium FACHB-63]